MATLNLADSSMNGGLRALELLPVRRGKKREEAHEEQQPSRADQRIRKDEHREYREPEAQAGGNILVVAHRESSAYCAHQQPQDAGQIKQRSRPAEHERNVHHAAVE